MIRHLALRLLVRAQTGASAVEYALLITGIAAVIALVVYAFGGSVADLFSGTCTSITTQRDGTTC